MKIKKVEHIDTIQFDESTKTIKISTHRFLARKVQISIFSFPLIIISLVLFLAEIYFYKITLGEIHLDRLLGIIIIIYVLVLLLFKIIWSKSLSKNPFMFFAINASIMVSFIGFSTVFLQTLGENFFIFNRANSILFFEIFLGFICFYVLNISIFILTWNIKIELRGLYDDIYANYTEMFRMFPFKIKKHMEIISNYETPLNVAISHAEKERSSAMSGDKLTVHYYTEQDFRDQPEDESKYYSLKVFKKNTTEHFLLVIATKEEMNDFFLKLTQLGKYLFITEKDLILESNPEYPWFMTKKEVNNSRGKEVLNESK